MKDPIDKVCEWAVYAVFGFGIAVALLLFAGMCFEVYRVITKT